MADEQQDKVIDYLQGRFERLDSIGRKLDEVVARVSSIAYHFTGFQRGLATIKLRLGKLDRRVERIERFLELIDAPA